MAFASTTLTILFLAISIPNGSGWYLQRPPPSTYPVPPFDCHTRFPWPGIEPSSVHELHPADIDAVAAMGDSFTNAPIYFDLFQVRGNSWSVGGDYTLDEGVLTLPNILKKYNPNIKGYSNGVGLDSGLNVANAGDTSYNLPGQARMLVDRLQRETDFENDWKLITIFIGVNDLCRSCLAWEIHSAERYQENLRIALDTLHEEVPRAFVNVVLNFDVVPVAGIGSSLECQAAHRIECPCGVFEDQAEPTTNMTHAYQDMAEALIDSGRYDTREDFTVVVQPFYKQVEPPIRTDRMTVDMSFYGLDCFHWSGKGQGAVALALWNNMCEPVGKKQKNWYLNQGFNCPGSVGSNDHPFFKTAKN